MAGNFIITICREFGSEGHEIGKELSERLGIKLYDKDLILMAAKESGLEEKTVASADEAVTNHFLASYMPFRTDPGTDNDKVFKAQSKVIRLLAERESCIIIGRLADYILKDEPNCMKVLIGAPFEARADLIAKKHGITPEAAAKLVKRMDTERNAYYNYYSKGRWSRSDGKDLIINRGAYGLQGSVELLEAAVKAFQAEKIK